MVSGTQELVALCFKLKAACQLDGNLQAQQL